MANIDSVDGALRTALEPSNAEPFSLQPFKEIGKENCATQIVSTQGTVLNDVRANAIYVTAQYGSKEPPVHNDEDIKGILNEVKEKLKRCYIETDVPFVPWLPDVCLPIDKIYTDIEMHIQETITKTSTKRFAKVEDIFSSNNGIVPVRILISGSPGSGKSTLLKKLVHEWAKGTEFLSKFEFALIVPLRFVTKSIESSMLDVMMSEKNDDSRKLILKLLKKHEEKVLLLLDGYDELQKHLEPEIVQFIKAEKYPRMTIVITSRRGKFVLSISQKKHIFANHQFMSMISTNDTTSLSQCAKHICIDGISQEKQHEFLEMHLSSAIPIGNLGCLSKALNIIRGHGKLLCSSPLYLLFIASLVSEVDIVIPRTITQLFKMMITFAVHRHEFSGFLGAKFTADRKSFMSMVGCLFNVNHISFGRSCNVFQQLGKYLFTDICLNEISDFGKILHNKMNRYIHSVVYKVPVSFQDHVLEQVGELSASLLAKGKLVFTDEYLEEVVGRNNRIADLGLFVSSTESLNVEMTKTYEPIHKSILEFCGAHYLRTLFLRNNLKEFSRWIFLLKDLWPQYDSDSLLFPFLAGLLSREMSIVFKLIHRIAFLYSYDFSLLLDTLVECEINEELLETVTDFLPLGWSLNEFSLLSNSAHMKLLHHAVNSNRLKMLKLDRQLTLDETESLVVERIRVSLDDVQFVGLGSFQRIKCDQLNCILDNVTLVDKSIWNKFCYLVKICNANHITLELRDSSVDSYVLLHNEMTSGQWKNVTIYHLQCTLRTKHALPHLVNLVTQKRINSLHVNIGEEPENGHCEICGNFDCAATNEDFQLLINSVGDCEFLINFFLHDYCTRKLYTVNISPLFCKKRSWNWLWFVNVGIEWFKIRNDVKVELFDLQFKRHAQLAVKGLLFYPIACLSCNSTIFKELVEATSWITMDSIVELMLYLKDSDVTEQCCSSLKKLKNLKTLALWFAKPTSSKPQLQAVHEIVTALNSISKPTLELRFIEKDLQFVNIIVDEIVEFDAHIVHLQKNGLEHSSLLKSLMLFINYKLNTRNYISEQADAVTQILSLLARLKDALRRKTVKKFHIVTQKDFHTFLQHNQPFGISSIADIFTWDEGYVISYDFFGSRCNDTTRSRNDLKFYGYYQRFTVTWKGVKASESPITFI